MVKEARRKRRVVAFDAQGMLGNKTGIGHFSYTLVEQLANTMPEVDFVGYYYDFLLRSKANLPNKANISYVKHRLLPVQVVNLLRRYHIEIPLELRIFKKADVVLFLNYLSAPSLSRTPSLGFIYDLSFLDHPEFVSKKNRSDLRRFVPKTIKRSRHVVTISEFAKRRISHYYPGLENRVMVVPIPPATVGTMNQPLSEQLRALGVTEHGYILYVGTLEPRKNITNLVRAYGLMSETARSSYALVLAGGKGWQDEDLVETIKQQQAAGSNIIQTGYVNDDERAALYQNATCFILPSHYEGFGMPIFEAFQNDLPVVVSDIPVFREVAAGAALYFDKDSPAAIASALKEVVENKSLRSKLIAGGRKQIGKYSWTNNAQQLRKVLESLF